MFRCSVAAAFTINVEFAVDSHWKFKFGVTEIALLMLTMPEYVCVSPKLMVPR